MVYVCFSFYLFIFFIYSDFYVFLFLLLLVVVEEVVMIILSFQLQFLRNELHFPRFIKV